MSDSVENFLSSSVEDYLKAIYLQTREGKPTTTLALAETLNVRSASVTNMLQRLSEGQQGLIHYRKRYGVSLTPEGEKAALQIIRRHRLLEQFLYQVLGYPLEEVHQEAEKLEHVVSPLFIESIVRLMQNPVYDPHGHPIPDPDLVMSDARKLRRLSDLNEGDKAVVRKLSDQDRDMLTFLLTVGITPGVEIVVIQKNPLDGSLQFQIKGSELSQVLGEATCASIQVEMAV